MDRYRIALNKKLIELKGAGVESFGFDSDPMPVSKKFLPFRLSPGEERRIGIVYSDPMHIFVGANTHYYNRRMFLCKSRTPDQPGGHREICCSRPVIRRLACPIIVYRPTESGGAGFEVRAWVFGNSVFNKIRELHQQRPIDKTDFYIRATGEMYSPWDIRFAGNVTAASWWQNNSQLKESVLRAAEPILKNIKSYLGQDLNSFEIRQLLSEPDQNTGITRQRGYTQTQPAQRSYARPPRPVQRDSFDEFFEILVRAPENQRAEPDTPSEQQRPIPSRIDLDQILDGI